MVQIRFSSGSVWVPELVIAFVCASDLIQFVDHAWHIGLLDSQWASHTEFRAARAVGAAAFVGCRRNRLKARTDNEDNIMQ